MTRNFGCALCAGADPGCEVEITVGDCGAAHAWARDGESIADEAQESRSHHSPFPIDGHPHETQQRDARCLHVGAQYLVRVAAGEKHIGTDHLGGVVGADAQQIRRLQP